MLCLAGVVQAQTPALPRPDSVLSQRVDSLAGRANQKIEQVASRADSLVNTRQQQLDSLRQRANAVGQRVHSGVGHWSARLTGRQDSLRQRLSRLSVPDSLFVFDAQLRQVDSLKRVVNARMQELQQRLEGKADVIRQKTDSLQKAYTQKAEELYARFREKAGDRFGQYEGGITEKLSLTSPSASAKIPELEGLSLPELQNLNLPELGSGLNANLPGLPNMNLPGTPDLNLPGNAGGGLPQANLPGADQLGQVGDLKNSLDKVSGWQQEAGAYAEEAQRMKQEGLAGAEKLPELAEQHVGKLEEIATIQQHQKQLEKIQQMQQQYTQQVEQFRDSARLTRETEEKLKNLAHEQFESQAQQLEQAQGQLARYKKKFSDIQSIHTLPKRPPNPMREKPFRERFFPGLMMQMVKRDYYSVDFAPQFYYHWRPRWQPGAGLVYRVNVNVDQRTFPNPDAMWGYKVFTNFIAFKGWYARVEAERVNFRLRPTTAAAYSEQRLWTNTLLVGTGREFPLNRLLRLNTQLLYNTLHAHDNPYASKVLLRFGFTFSLQKDQRRGFIRKLKEAGKLTEVQ